MAANPSAAFHWFSEAAHQNDPRALRELARCYYSGIGTEKDPEAGLECLTLAGKAGDEESNILLDMQNISTSEQAEVTSGF
ncbi:hypothetical protein SDC9_144272 [bioreactor metagenome]|uniref:Secretory immunoglobulin A-binding protein EsiB n=1 Tax=bioreactor metagenome TaxID=1076179 RepID=A0A645E6E0_9ZZZZ